MSSDRYADAVRAVLGKNATARTTSIIRDELRVSYNEAARYTERMENEGILSPPNFVGVRTILRRSK